MGGEGGGILAIETREWEIGRSPSGPGERARGEAAAVAVAESGAGRNLAMHTGGGLPPREEANRQRPWTLIAAKDT